MKTLILAAIGLGLCIQANAESISTADGKTYQNITTRRVDPDGLYIEYTLPGGGMGMSKVKFSRLTADQQKQFNFDSNKAKDYETQVAKANEDFRQECIRRELASQTQRAAQQAQATQDERNINERIMAMAQLKQAEAELARSGGGDGNGGGGYGGYYGGGDIGAVAIPRVGRAPRARTEYAPVVTPIPFPRVNTPHSNR